MSARVLAVAEPSADEEVQDEGAGERADLLSSPPLPAGVLRRSPQSRRLLLLLPLAVAVVLCLALPEGQDACRSLGRHVAQLWTLRRVGRDDRKAILAECYFDVSIGTLYLARAGLEIRDSASICPSIERTELEAAEYMWKALHVPNVSRAERAKQMKEALVIHKAIYSPLGAKLQKLKGKLPAVPHLDVPPGVPASPRHMQERVHRARARAFAASMNASEVLRRHRRWLAERIANSTLEATPLSGSLAGIADQLDPDARARRLHANLDSARRLALAATQKARARRLSVLESSKHIPRIIEELRGGWGNRSLHPVIDYTLHALNRSVSAQVQRRVCTSVISGTISSFTYTSAYFSAACSECAVMYNQQDYCASDLSRIVASMAEMSAGASATAAICTVEGRVAHSGAPSDFERRLHAPQSPDTEPSLLDLLPGRPGANASREFLHEGVTRLKELVKANSSHAHLLPGLAPRPGEGPEEGRKVSRRSTNSCEALLLELTESLKEFKEKGREWQEDHHEELKELKDKADELNTCMVENAECAVDVSQSVEFLGRAGMEINGGIVKGPYGPEPQTSHREGAAASLGTLAAFSLASFMVSNAVSECGHNLNIDAACSGAISQLMASFFEMSASAAGFAGSCKDLWKAENKHREHR